MPKVTTKQALLLSLIIGIVITGSTEHITIPIMVTYFESIYFITFVSSLQGCLNYGIILLAIAKYTKTKFPKPKNIKLIVIAGIANALMSLCFVYSASPARTPVVIQSIFLGLAIFPSVFFTKFILNKNIKYEKKFIMPSLVCLMISIIIAIAPLFGEEETGNHWWIIGYLMAVLLLGVDNIMQEKYVTEDLDKSLRNKLIFAFYTSVCQFVTIVSLCWVEGLFGYTNNSWQAFANSWQSINNSNFWLIELFIFDCLILYVLSICLNSISTNYNMILTNLTNQSVAIFFTIFPALNSGIKHSLTLVIFSLLFNIVSVILWIMGETRVVDKLAPLELDVMFNTEQQSDKPYDIMAPLSTSEPQTNTLGEIVIPKI